MGEGEIDPCQNRPAGGGGLGDETVTHALAAPVAPVIGKQRFRRGTAGPRHGNLDAGLARAPRP